MDRLFATLFALYIAYSVLVAIVRKMRTDPDPALPPVHRPDEFPWPALDDVPDDAEPVSSPGESSPKPAPAFELGPGDRSSQEPLPAPQVALSPAAETPVDALPVRSKGAPMEAGEPLPSPVLAGKPPGASHAPAAPSVEAGRKVALTPAQIRKAIIVTELLGPPRAVRPYSPFPWHR